MNYLLYCVTEPAAVPPPTGIRGAGVESLDENGLRCFYSAVDSLAPDPETLQRDALEFHRVTRELFRQSVIIPFRFPTALESVAQIATHMRNHAPAYRAALAEFRDTVQMELRIASSEVEAGSTGTQYLKARADHARRTESAVQACRIAITTKVIHWRQREFPHGVRCFALIRREAVHSFQEQVQRIRLDGAVTATLSGPWPPTEFFPAFHD